MGGANPMRLYVKGQNPALDGFIKGLRDREVTWSSLDILEAMRTYFMLTHIEGDPLDITQPVLDVHSQKLERFVMDAENLHKGFF